MTKRPAFFMGSGHNGELVREEQFEFNWYPGFSFSQKQKNMTALHSAIKKKYPSSKVLEISSKSDKSYGVDLSAFNLLLKLDERNVSVECAFQSSKVFENNAQYLDLLDKTSLEAKTDIRIRTSGNLKKFRFSNVEWDIIPTTSFYDWLYIKALSEPRNKNLASHILESDCFTDIEFNPKKSFNCQARSAALYKYLFTHTLLEPALSSKDNYLKIIANRFYNHKDDKKNLEWGTLPGCYKSANL